MNTDEKLTQLANLEKRIAEVDQAAATYAQSRYVFDMRNSLAESYNAVIAELTKAGVEHGRKKMTCHTLNDSPAKPPLAVELFLDGVSLDRPKPPRKQSIFCDGLG